MDNLGERIKAIRFRLGQSLEEFGKNFDPPASKGLVGNWEKNRNRPNNARLAKIAKLGGITLDELLFGNLTQKNIDHAKKIYKKLLLSYEPNSEEYKAFNHYNNSTLDDTLREFLSWYYSVPWVSENRIKGLNTLMFESFILEKYQKEIKTNQNLINIILGKISPLEDTIHSYPSYTDTEVQLSISKNLTPLLSKELDGSILIAYEYENSINKELMHELSMIIENAQKDITKLKSKYPDTPKEKKQETIIISEDKKTWVDDGTDNKHKNELNLTEQEEKIIIEIARQLIDRKQEK